MEVTNTGSTPKVLDTQLFNNGRLVQEEPQESISDLMEESSELVKVNPTEEQIQAYIEAKPTEEQLQTYERS